MPIRLPNLDDRTFEELVAAAKRLIPAHAPSWTDHNPSDPGITLVELFAYLTEMQLYRANRISEPALEAFVRLLRGDPAYKITQNIEQEIGDAVQALRLENRAVTVADFRELVMRNHPQVARVHCLQGSRVDVTPRSFNAPSHISLLVVPNSPSTPMENPIPSESLVNELLVDLRPRCLLTTRLHVAGPRYVKVQVNLQARIFADQSQGDVAQQMSDRLNDFLHPLRGGRNGQGWPFGGAVYLSEVLASLDGVPGVDWVEAIPGRAALLSSDPNRSITDGGQLVGLRLQPDELVQFDPSSSFTITQHRDLFPQQ
ncbi:MULTISPECIES: hypothetical protein [unclassified Cyanobium]|uniref:hypothetical protein n=1 Tax=unclassified Cyanobium TaxID=2627006 RepID=UPI0020CB6D19|nr:MULTISPECIES: hypothetical protein [unclassified Cyanobium]MCP9835703.1 hypothetical protein [Cyanobium sp. La Preciosa 7G6]MCP9938472.1 hypothetical protein [Cyanobium sp. Aljojuca 7A6]